MKFFSLASIFALAGFASAATYIISVGENNGFTYDPPSIDNATNGDIIAFQFKAKNHSVTQSTFNAPCTKSGVDSGFFPVNASATVIPQWSFTVNNASAPLWFFCAQTGHCAKGMVFALNPTAEKTFAMFQSNANATGSNTTTSSTLPSASIVSTSPSPTTTSGARPMLELTSTAGLLTVFGLLAGIVL